MQKSPERIILETRLARIRRDPYYIGRIPAPELTDEMCHVAMKWGAGDYEFFKWFLQKYPDFMTEDLCKIAVGAAPKKKDSGKRTQETKYGTISCQILYNYSEPVIKYVPEQFQTAPVFQESAKHDWRTLLFMPAKIQSSTPLLCEFALGSCDEIMTDDVDSTRRRKSLLNALDNSVFEQNPYIFDGLYTLQHVSADWVKTNPEAVCRILQLYPKQKGLLKYISGAGGVNPVAESLSGAHR